MVKAHFIIRQMLNQNLEDFFFFSCCFCLVVSEHCFCNVFMHQFFLRMDKSLLELMVMVYCMRVNKIVFMFTQKIIFGFDVQILAYTTRMCNVDSFTTGISSQILLLLLRYAHYRAKNFFFLQD